MKHFYVLLLLCSLIVGCSNEEDRSSEIQALQTKIRQIQKENEELKNLNGETGIVGENPTAEYNDTFLKDFCRLVEADDPKSLLAQVVESQQYLDYYVRIINNVKNAVSQCSYQKTLFYDHPFDIAEYKTDKGYLYVEANYSPEFKIRRFVPLAFDYQVDMTLHTVPTRDGESLTTWKIQRKKGAAKKGSIFLRTPYMLYGGIVANAYLSLFFDKTLYLQANRGSHSSTGSFKWLDPVNIDDSYDSIDWIIKQPRSNGKVMAYGVSYDGYDALASAASNHPALKSVVACSAPANAATDSFTSSQFVENGIFPYVTSDRKYQTFSDSGSYWEFINTEVSNLGRSRMDDILLGFDSEEWNATSAAIDDRKNEYWKNRQLLTALEKAKMPIAHVAGLVRDQDGRDTYLGFQHIFENSKFKDQNYLVLHKEGHGCGDFFQKLPLAPKLIGLTDDESNFDPTSETRFSVYTKSKNDYERSDRWEDLPLDTQTLTFDEPLSLQDYALQQVKDPNLYSKSVVFQFDKATILNGAPVMNLVLKANAPEVPVHIHFYVISPMGTFIEGTHGWRTAAISSKMNQIEQVELIFPLVNASVPAGSQLVVEFSTRNERVFLRNPASRQNLLEFPGLIRGIEIVTDGELKTELILPVEKNLASKLAEQEADQVQENGEDEAQETEAP